MKPETEALNVTDAGYSADLSEQSFLRLASYITSELGIKMPASKLSLIQSRLLPRVRELGLSSVQQYVDNFLSAPGEHQEAEILTNLVTTNKTDFFRESEHFAFLCDVALPSLNIPSGERFHVWSAGCSSGEEAYTLAMLLDDRAARMPGFDFSILATDISTRVLQVARKGVYNRAQTAPVPPEFRRKYMLRSRDRSAGLCRVVPHLRSKVSFHRLNFMQKDYPIDDIFHVVFFRNVMIYFDKATQEAVLNRMCRNLVSGGYLFIGHSDSISALDVPLTIVKPSIYRKAG